MKQSQVKTFYFGSEGARMYASYHVPDSGRDQNQGLLFASPVGHEYIRSHRMLRQMAIQLAALGFHVFRFDYLGLGDSDGEFEDVDLTVWQENLVAAKAELKGLAGIRKISVIGVRLGATIALRANKESGLKVRQHTYWDPIINGGQYVEELKKSHQLMLVDPMRFLELSVSSESENYMEALGYRYGAALLSQLKRIDGGGVTDLLDRGSFNVLAGPDVVGSLQALDPAAELSVVAAANPVQWADPHKVESTIVAPQEINQFTGMVR